MAYAVISVIGHDRPGFVRELAALAYEHELNIEDTRATGLGQEFAVLMGVTGSDGQIDGLAAALQSRSDALGLEYVLRRSKASAESPAATELAATVLAMDHPGIVHAVTGFFADRGLNITELSTETRPAPHTGAPMFDLRLIVQFPDNSSVQNIDPHGNTDMESLIQAFTSFCNEEDLDGNMEALS